MIRAGLAVALLGMLPAQAMAGRQITLTPGQTAPDLRPCITYAGVGALRMTGKVDPDPEVVGDNDILIDHPRYHYRYTQTAALFGTGQPRPIELIMPGHAPRQVDAKRVLLLLPPGDKGDFGWNWHWEWVWTDTRGRPFVPILQWPDPGSDNWLPRASRRFVRLVEYRDPQPAWADTSLVDMFYRDGDEEEEEYGDRLRLFELRDGKPRVRYGLYLSDIAEMFKAADAEEDCWR